MLLEITIGTSRGKLCGRTYSGRTCAYCFPLIPLLIVIPTKVHLLPLTTYAIMFVSYWFIRAKANKVLANDLKVCEYENDKINWKKYIPGIKMKELWLHTNKMCLIRMLKVIKRCPAQLILMSLRFYAQVQFAYQIDNLLLGTTRVLAHRSEVSD